VCGLDLSDLGKSPVASYYRYINKPLHFIKGGEFIHELSYYQLLRHSASWSLLILLSLFPYCYFLFLLLTVLFFLLLFIV